MSAPENEQDSTAEAVEEVEREYEVTLSVEGWVTVVVDAKDEDEARETAQDNWRFLCSSSDIEYDCASVEAVTVRS